LRARREFIGVIDDDLFVGKFDEIGILERRKTLSRFRFHHRHFSGADQTPVLELAERPCRGVSEALLDACVFASGAYDLLLGRGEVSKWKSRPFCYEGATKFG